MNQFLSASWDLIFYWILMDFGRKMEPSWHPDGIKNRCQLRKAFFLNVCFSIGNTLSLKVLEVEVGTKNRSTIHHKMKASWEGLLASIFLRFSSILEAKMDPSWEGKSLKNRSKKALKNTCQKVPVWAASWLHLGRLLVPFSPRQRAGGARRHLSGAPLQPPFL